MSKKPSRTPLKSRGYVHATATPTNARAAFASLSAPAKELRMRPWLAAPKVRWPAAAMDTKKAHGHGEAAVDDAVVARQRRVLQFIVVGRGVVVREVRRREHGDEEQRAARREGAAELRQGLALLHEGRGEAPALLVRAVQRS